MYKLKNIIIGILILSTAYLIFCNFKLKEEVSSNKKIMESHQFSIDLKSKQISELHKMIFDLNEKTNSKIDTFLSLEPYN